MCVNSGEQLIKGVKCLSETAGFFMWTDIDIRQYKLAVFDVDGTILEPNKEIHPFTRPVLLDLKQAGIPFTLATGKNMKSTRAVAEVLEIDLPLILANGCILQTLNGTIHQKHLLNSEFIWKLIDECEDVGLDLAIHINEDIYVKEINNHVSLLCEYGSPNLEVVGDWKKASHLIPEAYKCIAINREIRAPLFALEQKMKERVGDSVEYCHTLEEMVEFMPKGVSKMTGLNAILKEMGISLREVLAFGNGFNDIDMLHAAGFGVAVENAIQPLKDHADLIVPSCAENGPALFLQSLLNKL